MRSQNERDAASTVPILPGLFDASANVAFVIFIGSYLLSKFIID
jgi:hypothetical protein